MAKKIFVTGAGGYIGCVMTAYLLERGYEVIAFDRFYFGQDKLRRLAGNSALTIIKNDIRDIEPADLEGVDAVCDLAALSNDPTGDLDAELTYEINYRGRVRVATAAKNAGVPRYLLSSSCSVYGQGADEDLSEAAPTAPLTTYARANLRAEEEILPLADKHFTATVLRNATVFGLSPRMRFDLVVNLMTLHAVERGKITIMGGGRQWRPLIHVEDVARAFATVIEAPAAQVNGQIYNIGHTNAQVLSVAYIIREALPFPLQIEIAPDDPDRRNYNVSFEKARRQLGFKAERGIAEGARDIYDALKLGAVENGPMTSTVRWYRSVLDAQKLVETLTLNGRLL